MARTVIAFVGENSNNILGCQSQRFSALLSAMGLEGHVVRLCQSDTAERIAELLQGDVAWAWGYAGVGARLTLQGAPLWSALRIPFVSVLADAPYIMPTNHRVESPWVVNGYVYKEWLDFQRRHIRSPQLSDMLPMGVIANEHRQAVRPAERPLRMVFVKSGGDPDAQRARWASWPARLRPVLHESADALVALQTGPIVDVVLDCLAAHGLVLERRPLMFGLLHELDTYVRTVRATAMARALLPLPVEVIGAGWEHVAGLEGRARFRPPIAAEELEMLYAQTQTLVNVSPNLGSGAHERVLRGFAARCRVVSDDNEHSRLRLRGLPSYRGVAWNGADLADRLAAVFHEPPPNDDEVAPAEAYVREAHDPAAFLNGMAEAAELARLTPTMAGYALDAA